jgi:hypothetical protein
MLKLYTDQQYLTAEKRSTVFPLLFDLWYFPNANLLEKYQIVSRLEDCDIAVVPIDIVYFLANNKIEELNAFIDEALKAQKKVWVYTAGDFGITLNREVYTFRLGGFNSKLDNSTFVLPAHAIDPYESKHFIFNSLAKKELPSIGFVGNADGSRLKLAKEFLIYLRINGYRILRKSFEDYQPFFPSARERFKALKRLQNSSQIKTDFIFRKKYRAGAKTKEERKQTTIAFLENIYNNPYTLCLRGGGNFSVRFYETLAMGRIPVLIDTDIRLPLDTIIDWKKHCVITSKSNFEEKLIQFHSSISDEDFKHMQESNRTLWLNYLNREVYFQSVYNIFKYK